MRTSLFLLSILLSGLVFGQSPKQDVDFSTFVKDISRSSNDGNKLKMSLWMPPNYWDLVAKGNPQFDKKSVESLKALIGGYTLVLVYSGELSTSTRSFVSESEETIRKSVTLEYNNKKYKPLSPNQLPEELAQFSAYLKPTMTQMFGTMGPGMNFFFFDIKDANKASLIDPYKDTDFKITVDSETFNYNLPLPSLFEDKKCEVDGENYPSNYNFCPIHGNELK